jgi:hypothetical protein
MMCVADWQNKQVEIIITKFRQFMRPRSLWDEIGVCGYYLLIFFLTGRRRAHELLFSRRINLNSFARR